MIDPTSQTPSQQVPLQQQEKQEQKTPDQNTQPVQQPNVVDTKTETPKEEVKKETETKPAETKPTETKPTETKPTETKPTETKPAETKSDEQKPESTKQVEEKKEEEKKEEIKKEETEAPIAKEEPIEEPKSKEEKEPVKETKPEETKPEETKPTSFSLSWEKQKPFKELSFHDLIMWRNIYATFFVFLAGHALYTLLNRYGFSLVTLCARVLFFQVVIFFVYSIVLQLWSSKSSVEFSFSKFKLTKEMVQPCVDGAIERINCFISCYISILEVRKVSTTLKTLLFLQFLCMLGNCIRGMTLLYIVFMFGFTLPKFYEVYKKPIDMYACAGKKKFEELMQKGYDAIPKSVKDHFQSFTNKISKVKKEQ